MAAVIAPSWVPRDHIHSKLVAAYAPSNTPAQLSQATKSDTIAAHTSSQGDDQHEHDPHHLPKFDEKTLQSPTKPILYLPPLLSKLPLGYSHLPEPVSNYQPLATETHLPDIDPVSLLLHKELHHFHTVTDDYAETPYENAFNWNELILPDYAEREWYAVVFRSKRKEGSDGGREYNTQYLNIFQMTDLCAALYEADRKAHEEAVLNGGVS